MNLLPALVAVCALTAVLPSQQTGALHLQDAATSVDLRRMAIELKREPKTRLPAVARTAWTAPSDRVRSAAAQLLVRLGLAGAAVEHVAPGLRHPDPRVRARAAVALRRLGYPDAERLLALPPRETGRTTTRQHVAFLDQQAYLRDFDVEVA